MTPTSAKNDPLPRQPAASGAAPISEGTETGTPELRSEHLEKRFRELKTLLAEALPSVSIEHMRLIEGRKTSLHRVASRIDSDASDYVKNQVTLGLEARAALDLAMGKDPDPALAGELREAAIQFVSRIFSPDEIRAFRKKLAENETKLLDQTILRLGRRFGSEIDEISWIQVSDMGRNTELTRADQSTICESLRGDGKNNFIDTARDIIRGILLDAVSDGSVPIGYLEASSIQSRIAALATGQEISIGKDLIPPATDSISPFDSVARAHCRIRAKRIPLDTKGQSSELKTVYEIDQMHPVFSTIAIHHSDGEAFENLYREKQVKPNEQQRNVVIARPGDLLILGEQLFITLPELDAVAQRMAV